MFASPADYVREPIHVAGLDDGLHPSTAQKNINLGILETVIIPLPPVREIRRIVAKVDQMMAFCDELEAKIEANQNTAEHFAEAVVVELAD